MSHVEFKKWPMSCHYFFWSCRYGLCRMSILRNGCVAVSNLGVKGHRDLQIFTESESKECRDYHFCLFVCGISLTSGQLIIELFPDCTRSCFSQVVSRRRGGDRIYEMRCLFVAVGPNARFIVLPHWDNMS